MGTDKESLKKKVLDALKEELQPMNEDENSQLTGGFSSTSASLSDTIGLNVSCPDTSNTNCNTVSGCGAKVAQSL